MQEIRERIEHLRRELPGAVLSQFDHLARQYANPVALLVGDVCQGCQEHIPSRVLRFIRQSHEIIQCERCGRFLIPEERAPDYISAP